MSEGTEQRQTVTGRPVSPWAVGFAVFAACVMVLSGVFGAIMGFAAILENQVYVFRGDYVFKWDLTTWGWIHLIVGLFVAAAGLAVFTGRVWARTVGIVLAGLSAIVHFMFLPYYPVWSLLVIALDIVVIWALTVYSRQAATSLR